jgi:hypothetical protein
VLQLHPSAVGHHLLLHLQLLRLPLQLLPLLLLPQEQLLLLLPGQACR